MEVSVSLLYLIPIVITAWLLGRWAGIALSAQCAIEGFLAGQTDLSTYSNPAIPFWNATMMFGFYVAVTLLLIALRDSLRKERDFARQIQENLLPRKLDLTPAMNVAAAWMPSLDVSGDYFDIFPLGNDRYGFCIADVSGHGMAAALLMSNVQSAVRLLARYRGTPTEICERLNFRACTAYPDGVFLTFVFGILHVRTGEIRYCNAGHNYPLVMRRNGTIESLRGSGVPLGIVPNWVYEDQSVFLRSGETIFLYTDGVTEARNLTGELFGEGRLIDILKENSSRSPERIKESVLGAVEAFSQGHIDDDVTLLCIALKEDGAHGSSAARSAELIASSSET
jgi:sigma-B regulation protein RsbU (phosphoserine phosphatase)